MYDEQIPRSLRFLVQPDRLSRQGHAKGQDGVRQAARRRADMENPYYAGFRVDRQEIGLDPNGHKKGMTGPLGYCEVADIRKTLQSLVDAGVRVTQEVKDVGGGRLTAWLADADGNPIGLLQMS